MRKLGLILLIFVCVFVLYRHSRAVASSPALDLICGPDVNRDGVVNLTDLVRVAALYGQDVDGGLPPEFRTGYCAVPTDGPCGDLDAGSGFYCFPDDNGNEQA